MELNMQDGTPKFQPANRGQIFYENLSILKTSPASVVRLTDHCISKTKASHEIHESVIWAAGSFVEFVLISGLLLFASTRTRFLPFLAQMSEDF
jgi:hypothetical protein